MKTENIIRTIGLSAVLFSAIYAGLYVRDNEFHNTVKDQPKPAIVQPANSAKESAVVSIKGSLFAKF